MKFSQIICGMISLLILNPAFASVHLGGNLGLDSMDYFQPENGVNNSVTTLSGEFTASDRLNYSQSLKLDLDGHFQPDNKSASEQWFLNPKEAYYQWRSRPVEIQVGMNTFTWGVTDGYNPVDVVNPRQYFDPLDPEKLGTPSLHIKVYQDHVSLDLIYIPAQLKPQLPGANSRWLPRDQIQVSSSQSYTILLPSEGLSYHYLQDSQVDNALENNVGLRLQGTWNNIDASVEGFSGNAPFPVLVPNANLTAVSLSPLTFLALDPNIGLQATYYRQSMGGATVVGTLGDYILRFETAYSAPTKDHEEILGFPGWTHESVVGLERTFNPRWGTVTALIQATYNQHDRTMDNSPTSLSQLWDHTAMGGLRYASPESTWQYLLATVVDTQGNGFLISSNLTYQLNDFWSMHLRMDNIHGKSGTFISSYNQNSCADLGLTRSW